MLYLLLSIIAVWVLISSEPGKKLLNMILIVIGIGWWLYVLYWAILFSFLFLRELFKTHPDFIIFLIFLGLLGCIFYAIDKFNMKKWKKKNYRLWTFHKNFIAIALASLSIFTILLVLVAIYLEKNS